MILRSILKGAALLVSSTGAAAGTTAVNGATIDLAATPGPFESVLGLCLLGTLTATQVTSLKAQGSDDGSTWVDLASTKAGPAADADGGKLLAIDLHRPAYRYVRFVVVRGTANAVVTCLISILYNGRREPITQLAAQVSGSAVVPYAVAGTP